MRNHVLTALCLTSVMLCGTERMVFQSNFAANKDLSGWKDCWPGKVPRKDMYAVQTQNGETFYTPLRLKGNLHCFGITHPFDKPLKITSSMKQICLQVTWRQSLTQSVSFAITSRKTPASTLAFSRQAKEYGFQVHAYPRSVEKLNYLAYNKAGNITFTYKSKAPFELFHASANWNTWKVIYKPAEKALQLYTGAVQPVLEQHGVDLTGAELLSIWLSGQGAAYKDVKVTVIE